MRIGYLKIALAAIIWGTISLFVRALDLPVLTMVFYRFVFALLGLFLIIALRRDFSSLAVKRSKFLLLTAGLILTLNWIFFFYALVLTTVAQAVLLTYTAPILIALFSPVFLKEKLELNTLFSLALAAGGTLLIISPSQIILEKSFLGILFALGTSLTYAALVFLSKYLLENLSVFTIIFYESLFAVLALSPVAYSLSFPSGFKSWLFLIILGLVHTLLAPYLFLSGLKVVKTQRAGIFTYLDPLTATFLAAFFLAEMPTVLTLIGGVLIIAAGYNVAREGTSG